MRGAERWEYGRGGVGGYYLFIYYNVSTFTMGCIPSQRSQERDFLISQTVMCDIPVD